jgi:flagellin
MLAVRTNVSSINAQRNLAGNSGELGKAMERLSSGFRINRAADDAAGLAISENLKSQIGGSNQAMRNMADAISMIQTSEGALDEVSSMLQRMRDLSVQAANGSLDSVQRGNIGQELSQLSNELTSIKSRTVFNGNQVLNGQTFQFQSGAQATDTTNVVTVNLVAANVTGATANALNYSGANATAANATALITQLDTAIAYVTTQRAVLGAAQNRFEHTIGNLGTLAENLSASNSRIRDVDVAEESASLARFQILSQSATSILAQANQQPQLAMKLLG